MIKVERNFTFKFVFKFIASEPPFAHSAAIKAASLP